MNLDWLELCEESIVAFLRRQGSQLSTFQFNVHAHPGSEEDSSMPWLDYLSLLLDVEVLSLPSDNALQQSCPPLSSLRTLHLGESRLLCDAELWKDGISPSRFVIELARLLRILVNTSNKSSIQNEGRTRWISKTCPKLQEIGNPSLDWENKPLWRPGRVLKTAWLLRDCGLDLVDAFGRLFSVYTGQD